MLCIIRKGILVFLLACVGMLQAQQLKVIEFRADLSMTDAVQFSKNDFQGALCGLIKLGLTFNDVAFEGDIVAFEYHEGEWWIYMPKGSNYLSIKSRSDIFEPLYCKFPDYGIKGIESKVTYVMNVEIQSQKVPKKKIQPERKRRSSMAIAGLLNRKDLTKEQKKRRLEDLIEEFSIGRIRKQYAYTLSGGERRRTEIARSLAMEPKFLLLDEPFAGIDPIAVADIKSVIKLLSKRGIGILITDHNVRDTLEITDRAIIINTGTIMISGKKDEILKSDLAREIYLGKNFTM